jgi:Holliday junction DNA helicase RuvB
MLAEKVISKPIEFKYEPRTLDDFVAQDNQKTLIRLLIKQLYSGKMNHILLTGIMGTGKTCLSRIIANELGAEFNYCIGSTLTIEDFRNFLQKNERANKIQLLMIDEIHTLRKGKNLVGFELLYPILTDFVLANLKKEIRVTLKPFLIVGATTEIAYLEKNYTPFKNRFTQIDLNPYSSEDISEILKRYNDNVYKMAISNEVLHLLAENSRYNPRSAKRLLDLYAVSLNVKTVLDCNGIIIEGLTQKDLTILKFLSESKKSVSQDTLSSISQISSKQYRISVEPYLLQKNFLRIGYGGRIINQKGLAILKELEKDNANLV